MSRRGLAAALVGAALAAAAPAAGDLAPRGAAAPAGPADARAAVRASEWLASQRPSGMAGGQQADVIVALRAAGRSPGALRGRLRALGRAAPDYALTAGGAGKVVMAAVAAGADPRALGGVDYVRRIRSHYRDGRYGPSAFEQSLAILGLRAARAAVPAGAVRALRRARGSGGWAFALEPGARDSVDGTALVVEALRSTGVGARDPALRAATAWMLAQRNRAGGYASLGGGRAAEANSTAGVIRALRAMGRPAPAAARAALRRLQQDDGSVRFSARSAGSPLLATNDATVAFAGATLATLFAPGSEAT